MVGTVIIRIEICFKMGVRISDLIAVYDFVRSMSGRVFHSRTMLVGIALSKHLATQPS